MDAWNCDNQDHSKEKEKDTGKIWLIATKLKK